MPNTATTVMGEELNSVDKPTQTSQQTQEEFLAKYVGEGKKYKSVEDLAKAYANAETFIDTLKTEKQTLQQEMQTKLASAKTIEDIMSALTTTQQTTQSTSTEQTNTPTITAEDIAKMVETTLSQRQQVELIKVNQTKTWDALTKAFGTKDNAKKAVADYIGTDATKRELVDKMGSYTPDDLVELIKLKQKKDVVNFSEPADVASDMTLPTGDLSWAQVKQIKKQNPSLFKSREFQKRLHKLAAEGKLEF